MQFTATRPSSAEGFVSPFHGPSPDRTLVQIALAAVPPGWMVLRDCSLPSLRAGQPPIPMPITLLHPAFGVVLVEFAPDETPDAAQRFRHRLRLAAADLSAAEREALVVLHLRLEPDHAGRLGRALAHAQALHREAGKASDGRWLQPVLDVLVDPPVPDMRPGELQGDAVRRGRAVRGWAVALGGAGACLLALLLLAGAPTDTSRAPGREDASPRPSGARAAGTSAPPAPGLDLADANPPYVPLVLPLVTEAALPTSLPDGASDMAGDLPPSAAEPPMGEAAAFGSHDALPWPGTGLRAALDHDLGQPSKDLPPAQPVTPPGTLDPAAVRGPMLLVQASSDEAGDDARTTAGDSLAASREKPDLALDPIPEPPALRDLPGWHAALEPTGASVATDAPQAEAAGQLPIPEPPALRDLPGWHATSPGPSSATASRDMPRADMDGRPEQAIAEPPALRDLPDWHAAAPEPSGPVANPAGPPDGSASQSGPPMPQGASAVPTPADSAVQRAAVPPAPAAAPQRPSMPPAMAAALIRRGDAMMAAGDISAARLLYERAAEAGHGGAALAAGRTYDPAVLARAGARGLRPDAAAAAAWYRRALDMGEAAAEPLLREVTGGRPN